MLIRNNTVLISNNQTILISNNQTKLISHSKKTLLNNKIDKIEWQRRSTTENNRQNNKNLKSLIGRYRKINSGDL